jgi:hypothetical protein
MTQPNKYIRRRGFKSCLAHHWSDLFLETVSETDFLLDVNFIRQFFYQTEFEPTSKRQFETSEAMSILKIRHISK